MSEAERWCAWAGDACGCGPDYVAHSGCAGDTEQAMIHDPKGDGYCHTLDCHPFTVSPYLAAVRYQNEQIARILDPRHNPRGERHEAPRDAHEARHDSGRVGRGPEGVTGDDLPMGDGRDGDSAARDFEASDAALGVRQKEEWRGTGVDGYEVSSLGRVRSWRPYHGLPMPRMLTLSAQSQTRHNHRPGFRVTMAGRQYRVHRLVAFAFLGRPTPPADHVNHINGDRMDNRAENLEWVTIAENNRHAWDTGLRKASCLTVADVIEIRSSDEGVTALAKRLGVGVGAVQCARNGTSWAWLNGVVAPKRTRNKMVNEPISGRASR